jgi:superfamily II DNA/RNA helicase
LNENLLASLSSKGFLNASPIQELTIPTILEGKDIFAMAETGSGKTGAFAIPVLEKILRNTDKEVENLYIVLSPTRELAQQTHKVFSEFGAPLGITSTCIIGGGSFDKQKEEIAKKPEVLVATPGRFCDLMRQKVINIKNCNCVIFDEADRLFEMGFKKDIEQVLRAVKKERQLIMVSATTNQEVMQTAYKFHSHPEELKLNEDDLLVENINHEVAMISEEEKMPFLVNILRSRPDAYSIIFCNTQYMTHLVSAWLIQMGFTAEPISGRLAQNKRTRLMDDFRSKKFTTLVCTDVAARGLDIKDVNLVVNYDMPIEAANYVHRIGRTGRAGKSGYAISFCGFDDCEQLEAINEFIDGKIPKADLEDEHFATDVVRKPWMDSKTLQVIDRDKRNKEDREKRNDKKKSERSKKPMDKNKNKTERAPRAPRVFKERFFEVTTNSLEAAHKKAMSHFSIDNVELLEVKTLEVGKKKFFFFGSRETKYQIKVIANYKKLLLPMLIGLFKKMDLKVFVRVSFKHPNVRVSFSGKDAGLMVKNKFELQNSIEHICLTFLRNKIAIPSDTKIHFRTERQEDKKKFDKNLVSLAKKTMDQVAKSSEPVLMKSLNPADRRIIHQCVSENPKFASSSVGEGRFKQIEVSLKK